MAPGGPSNGALQVPGPGERSVFIMMMSVSRPRCLPADRRAHYGPPDPACKPRGDLPPLPIYAYGPAVIARPPLHVVHLLSVSLWSGPSQVAVNLLADGVRRGWRMTLVLFERRAAALERLRTEARAAGAEVIGLEAEWPFDPTLPRRLRRLLGRLDPDMVHCHGYKPALAGLLAGRARHRALVMTVHGWHRANRQLVLYEWLERRLAARFDRVFAVSPELRDALRQTGVAETKLVLARNAFDLTGAVWPDEAAIRAARGRWGLPDGPAVGAVGRLRREKGLDVLIRALAGQPGVPLVLVGDGPERAELERLAAELELQPAPVFAGETDRPLATLAALSVVALPSRSEGLPQSLLEAMALGRPVVASRVAGLPDVLDQGRCGLLVPPDDPEALRGAIRRLLDDPALAARLGRAARQRVETTYALAALGDLTEREYRAALAERG